MSAVRQSREAALMSDPDRDAAKAARQAAKAREKRSKQVAKIRAAREKGRSPARVPSWTSSLARSDGTEGRGLYWVIRSVLLGPPVRRSSTRWSKARRTCRAGAAILAANHLSFSDWVSCRWRWTGGSPSWPSRTTSRARVSRAAQRRFFAGTGQVPIDRSGGRASEAALRAAMKVLNRGDLFGIFPEGTRSHDGRLYKGRTGVARMALEAQVPVIPVGIIGTDVIAPPGKVISKVISPTVKFGVPLDFSRYQGMSEDRFILRSVTDEIMYAIMELSGQEYVDLYAPTAKELAAKQAKQDEEDEVSPQA